MPHFEKVDIPVFSPTACLVCRAQRDPGGFVDTLGSMPGWGRVYLCSACVTAAAKLWGFTEPGKAEKLQARLNERGALLDQMKGELEKAQDLRVVSNRELRKLVAAAAGKEKAA